MTCLDSGCVWVYIMQILCLVLCVLSHSGCPIAGVLRKKGVGEGMCARARVCVCACIVWIWVPYFALPQPPFHPHQGTSFQIAQTLPFHLQVLLCVMEQIRLTVLGGALELQPHPHS